MIKYLLGRFAFFLLKMDDGRLVKVILFQMGSLIVYYLASSSYVPYKFGDANLYWCDKEVPNGFGPFTSLDFTMKHYQETMSARKKAQPPSLSIVATSSNIILVDFVAKRKVPPYTSHNS